MSLPVALTFASTTVNSKLLPDAPEAVKQTVSTVLESRGCSSQANCRGADTGLVGSNPLLSSSIAYLHAILSVLLYIVFNLK